MKNTVFLLVALLVLVPLSAHASDSHQKSYTFRFKERTWTIQADRLERKGGVIYFRGNVKATSNQGEKIFAGMAELCQTRGKEKLTLSPVKRGSVVKATHEVSAKTH